CSGPGITIDKTFRATTPRSIATINAERSLSLLARDHRPGKSLAVAGADAPGPLAKPSRPRFGPPASRVGRRWSRSGGPTQRQPRDDLSAQGTARSALAPSRPLDQGSLDQGANRTCPFVRANAAFASSPAVGRWQQKGSSAQLLRIARLWLGQ